MSKLICRYLLKQCSDYVQSVNTTMETMKKHNIEKNGVSEFRSELPKYLHSETLTQVLCHVHTVGFYFLIEQGSKISNIAALQMEPLNLSTCLVKREFPRTILLASFVVCVKRTEQIREYIQTIDNKYVEYRLRIRTGTHARGTHTCFLTPESEQRCQFRVGYDDKTSQ